MRKFVLTALWLGILSVMDLVHKRVSVWLLAAGGITGVVTAVYAYAGGAKSATELIWGMLPGCLLLFVAVVSKKAGWADGIVLVAIGLLTDFQECMTCFVVSLTGISVVSLLLLVFRKVRKNTMLPYLPFLWVGYLFQEIALQL